MANYCNKICSVPYGPQYMIQYPCDTKPPDCWDNKVLDWMFGYERTNGTPGTATPGRRSTHGTDTTGAAAETTIPMWLKVVALAVGLYLIWKHT